MHRLWNQVISPLLTLTKPKVIVEIGSDRGANTENILELSREWDGIVHVIDPLPKYDVAEWEKRYGPRLQFHKELSLSALPSLPLAQAYLIDGDHNWYTVINELRLIGDAASKKGGDSRFPLVLLHDTGWPYGRRDLYYDPQTVPDAFRKPFKKAGMAPGTDELVGTGGLNPHLNNATRTDGRQNGVLTAVEDFVRETALDLATFSAPAYHGLTVITSKPQLQKSVRTARFLKQFGFSGLAGRLIGDLERSRVEAEIAREAEKRRREAEIAAIQNQLKRQDAQLEGADKDIEAAHKRTAAAEQLNGQLQESRERQEALIKSKDEGAARAEERIRALSERLASAETEAGASNAVKIALEHQIDVLKEHHKQILEIQDAAIRRAQESVHELERRVQAAQSAADATGAQAAASNAATGKQHDEALKLRDEVIARGQRTIAERDGRLAQLEQAVAAARDEVTRQGEVIGRRNAAIARGDHAIAEQNARLAQLEQAVAGARDEVTRQGEVIGRRNAAIARGEHAIAEQNARLAQLEQAVAAARDEVTRQGEVIGRRNAAIARGEHAIAEQDRRLAQLERAVSDARDEIRSREQTIKLRDEAIARGQQATAEQNARLELLEEAVADARDEARSREEAIKLRNEAIARGEQAVAEQYRRLELRDQAIARSEETIAEQCQRLAHLEQAVAAAREDVGRREEAIKLRDEAIALGQQAFAEQDRRLAQLEQAVADARDETRSRQEAVQLRDEVIARGQQAVAEQDRRLAQLAQAVADARDEVRTREEAIKVRDEAISQAQLTIGEQHGRLTTLEEAVATAQDQLGNLQAENLNLSCELDERSRMAKLDRRLIPWEAVAKSAEHQIDHLRERTEQLQTEITSAHDRTDQLQRDLERKREEIREAQQEARRSNLVLRALIEFRERFDAGMTKRRASRLLGPWFPRYMTRRIARRIQQTGFFDESWYLKTYPDVARSGVEPALHFARYGVFEGRDPSATFSTKHYLVENPDVVQAGINPVIHYAEHGAKEGRAAAAASEIRRQPAPRQVGKRTKATPKVEIVIPVYNALEEVGNCLLAVLRHSGTDFRVVIVNDGSASETTHWLRWFAARYKNLVVLLENEANQGYTRSINRGIQKTTGDYVVLLNSDTIVTPGWLDRLRQCAESNPRIGIVGPLSNAASWQNIPQLIGEDGKFAVNTLPQGWTVEAMAELVAECSNRRYPRVPFLNGFCFAITRKVIEAVGLFDDKNFPRGYGEENDYALRAAAAGYELAVADDCYVYHSKSKSFGHAQRLTLSKDGSEALKRKYGQSQVEALVTEIRNSKVLAEIRSGIAGHPKLQVQSIVRTSFTASVTLGQIAFLLPVSGVAGGIHSVMQEASAMRLMGIDAKVLIRAKDHAKYMSDYGRLPAIKDLLLPFDSNDHLLTLARSASVVVATIFTSVSLLSKIRAAYPELIAAYYVQDYEPLFFDEELPRTREAEASYSAVPGIVCFAKTDWICRQVSTRHEVSVERVIASVDHGVYHPRGRSGTDGRIGIAAMIRPHTPRRGAHRTLRALRKLANRFGEKIRIEIFGCDVAELEKHALQTDFPCHNSGVLTQEQVADLLRRNEIFLDLSDYQAFGRTALEAMACGCVVVVTDRGGASEFCVDGKNGFLVDVEDDSTVISRVASLIEDQEFRDAVVQNALTTAARYSPRSAALSEAFLFLDRMSTQRPFSSDVDTHVAPAAIESVTTLRAS